MSDNTIISRFPVPTQISIILFFLIFLIIVVSVSVLAFFNLFYNDAIFPSIIWILLVVFGVSYNIKEVGISKFCLDIFRVFSLKHFIDIKMNDLGLNILQIGFELFNRNVYYESFPVQDIETVKISSGQASDMAKRDCNDWSVVLYYDHNDPIKTEKQKKIMYKKPEQELIIIGPQRSKKKTEKYFHSLLNFLNAKGANLVSSDDDLIYNRKQK